MNCSRREVFSVFAGFLACLGMAGTGLGAYLESDGDSQPAKGQVPDRVLRPEPRPLRGNPVRALVGQLSVGRPTTYRNLTIFPLEIRRGSRSPDIRTLDEALSRDWITIREKESAQVSELLMRNDSRNYVFLMAGEIITGGKQNRIISSDVLLAPRSAFVAVPVYCGEKDRWTVSKGNFKSSEGVAAQPLRRLAAKSASQDAVWKEIDSQMTRAEVSSRTRNYQQIYQDKTVSREVGKCCDAYRRFCGSDTVGALVVSNNRIVSCDIFSNPNLLSRLWNKICRSYALECVVGSGAGRRIANRVDPADIRRFLNNITDARFHESSTPGLGTSLNLTGTVDGIALIWQSQVVHAAVFPVAWRPHDPVPVPYPVEPRKYGTEDRLWR